MNNRINNSAISSLSTNNINYSMYIGSRKRNVNLLLRIYDKKVEQIETNGYYLEKALDCSSWVRFEAVFKGNYAHQITEKLYTICGDIKLQQYLINLFLEKYIFYHIQNDELVLHQISLELLNTLKSDLITQTLFAPRPNNNDIVNSLLYIIKGSGLFPLLYKIEYLWGDDKSDKVFNFIYHIFKTRFNPSTDHTRWLENNNDSYNNILLEELFPLVIKLVDRGD